MINIVVFGPIHSGKSSLMGFLKANYMTSEERIEAERQIRLQLRDKGVPYKEENKYTYFVSTDKDEVITDSKQDSIGTTKRMHIKNISNISNGDLEVDLIFIDTPGMNSVGTWKDRYEGIFMGDIGVFVIDINEVIAIADMEKNSDEYNSAISEMFSCLFLWKTTKNMNQVIIALSKIDTISSVNDIGYAIEMIEELGYFNDATIIPIGIDFDAENDFNIISSDRIRENYKGPCFIDILFEILEEKIFAYTKNDTCFAYLERPLKIAETDESALRVKMLDGVMRQADRVIMLPVKQKKDNFFTKASFTVKSLKLEDRYIVNQIVSGNIGGVIPARISVGGKKVGLNETCMVKTTCIIGKNTPFTIGNLLSFKTRLYNRKSFDENFMKLRINQTINIVWFGKVITASFCSKYINNDYCYFNAYLKDYPIVMPLNKEKKYWIRNFALEVNNCYFFQAELESINNLNSDLEKIYFSFSKSIVDLSKNELEEYLKIKLEERGGNYEVWISVEEEKFKDIVKTFGKFVSKYKIADYIFNVMGSDGEIFIQTV